MIISILVAILGFGILIFIHELGHYSVARWCNIKIDEFAIGMGPKIFGFTRGETLYSIRAVPFGGYVKMEGEDQESDNDRAFCNKPAWQRFLVSVAGAFMNFLFGFILMLCLVISSDKISDMTVSGFVDESISDSFGLKIGDKILEIDNYKIKTASDFNYIIAEIADRPVDILVKRNKEIINLKQVKFPVFEDQESDIKIAMIDFKISQKDKTFFNVIKYSYDSVISNIKSVYVSLRGLISGKYKLKQMAGPVKITEIMATSVASNNIRQFIKFIVLITVNLGVLNLLPLPALDGGRAIILLFSMITKKNINQKIEGYIHFIGFALLMLLSVIIFYNDIVSLINKIIK